MTSANGMERREIPGGVANAAPVARSGARPRSFTLLASGLCAERVISLARLEEIRPQWLQLVGRAAPTAPFVHPAFLLPWYRQASLDGFRVAVLAVWRGERLVALLPLSTKPVAGGLVRRLSPPLYGSTPPFDMLADDQSAIEEALDLFFEQFAGWDTVLWPAMPVQSNVARIVTEHLRHKGHHLRMVPQEARHSVHLDGNWDAYLASLAKHDRKELARCWRVAEKTGTVRCGMFRPGDGDLETHLRNARTVVKASWKNSDEMTARGFDHLEKLARSLAEAGMFHVHTLFIDEQPVAYLSEIGHQGRRYAFHIAYDERHTACSPGRLVLTRAMQIAGDEGVSCYEFCGYRDYLRRLASDSEDFCSIEVVNRSALSRARVGGVGLVQRLRESARAQSVHQGERK